MKFLNIRGLTAAIATFCVTATSSLAADVTMNVGFGAPGALICGRFGKHLENFVEERQAHHLCFHKSLDE